MTTIARVVGYDRIPVREQIQIQLTPPEPEQKTRLRVHEVLVGSGYFEAVTFAFSGGVLEREIAGCGLHRDAIGRAKQVQESTGRRRGRRTHVRQRRRRWPGNRQPDRGHCRALDEFASRGHAATARATLIK